MFVVHKITTSRMLTSSIRAGSYCSLTPLCSGMGEAVPARTSLTLSPVPSHYAVIIVSKCPSAAIVATSTVRVNVISPRKAFHQKLGIQLGFRVELML